MSSKTRSRKRANLPPDSPGSDVDLETDSGSPSTKKFPKTTINVTVLKANPKPPVPKIRKTRPNANCNNSTIVRNSDDDGKMWEFTKKLIINSVANQSKLTTSANAGQKIYKLFSSSDESAAENSDCEHGVQDLHLSLISTVSNGTTTATSNVIKKKADEMVNKSFSNSKSEDEIYMGGRVAGVRSKSKDHVMDEEKLEEKNKHKSKSNFKRLLYEDGRNQNHSPLSSPKVKEKKQKRSDDVDENSNNSHQYEMETYVHMENESEESQGSTHTELVDHKVNRQTEEKTKDDRETKNPIIVLTDSESDSDPVPNDIENKDEGGLDPDSPNIDVGVDRETPPIVVPENPDLYSERSNGIEIQVDSNLRIYSTLQNARGPHMFLPPELLRATALDYKIGNIKPEEWSELYPGVKIGYHDINGVNYGFIEISPSTIKPFESEVTSTVLYWVVDGELILKTNALETIPTKPGTLTFRKFSYGPKGIIIMPPKVPYSFENPSTQSTVKIGFVELKLPVPVPPTST